MMKDKRNKKRIFDGDNQKLIGYFYQDETNQKIQELLNTGKWSDVDIDHEGDIVVFEEL